MSISKKSGLVLGINSSTQSLSCVVIDPWTGEVIVRVSINYGEDLGDVYGLSNGFEELDDGVVQSPTIMFVHAFDYLFARLMAALVDADREIGEIKAIAGSGQQHGSVYLNQTADRALSQLDPDQTLHGQLAGIFSRQYSPIWRDTSTSKQCEFLTEALGGPQALLELTGAVATERFTLPQILRIAQAEPELYQQTVEIHLISSFCCSLLSGRMAPIDFGDGAGMNLMNERHNWSPLVLSKAEELAPDLRWRLPKLTDSMTPVGPISPYYVGRYGFSPDCVVLPFSGDNCDSLLGTGVYEGGSVLVQSFGTSDTDIAITEKTFDPSGSGYVFGAVTGGNFGIGVYSNGSLTRENICQHFGLVTGDGQVDWPRFSEMLKQTPPGNDGQFMLPFFKPEITPNTRGESLVQYFNDLDPDDPKRCPRALVEAQFLNRQLHSTWLCGNPSRILATGGASVNRELLQVGADVNNVPYHIFDDPDSVSLGAALRAARAADQSLTWKDLTQTFCRPQGEPIWPKNPRAYVQLRDLYRDAQSKALSAISV